MFISVILHKIMPISGLAHILKQKPAVGGKISANMQDQDKQELQGRRNESLIERVKGDEDVFRRRTESSPGKRPNSKWKFIVQMYIFKMKYRDVRFIRSEYTDVAFFLFSSCCVCFLSLYFQ